jgi:hypothetical protein
MIEHGQCGHAVRDGRFEASFSCEVGVVMHWVKVPNDLGEGSHVCRTDHPLTSCLYHITLSIESNGHDNFKHPQLLQPQT